MDLWSNRGTMAKYMALAGQWMRNKEDLLMRDLFASSVNLDAEVKSSLIDLKLVA